MGVIVTLLFSASFFFCANRINYVPFFYGRDYAFFEGFIAKRDKVCDTMIFEYRVPGIMYHKKVMVVDKRYVIIGSYNLGVRSELNDYESILSIDSEEIAKKVLEVFEEDKKYAKNITPSQARDWYFNPAIAYLATLQKQFHHFF